MQQFIPTNRTLLLKILCMDKAQDREYLDYVAGEYCGCKIRLFIFASNRFQPSLPFEEMTQVLEFK